MGKILWTNKKPTAAELHARTLDEALAAQTLRDRAIREALAEEADPVFFKWQRGEATEVEWHAKIAEVKARFPAE